jgi:hypothetical protein
MERWQQYCESLTYPNKHILVCDNSDDVNYKRLLEKRGLECLYVNPGGKGNIEYITESQNRLRQYAIDENFDWIMSLEVDVLPPIDNLIELLLFHKKPVVGLTYYIGKDENSRLMLQIINGDREYSSLLNLIHPYDSLFINGEVKPIGSIGLGCLLIHKSVFKKIKFRFEKNMNAHADTFFALDCHYNNIPIYCDTSMICEHDNLDWNKLHKQIRIL